MKKITIHEQTKLLGTPAVPINMILKYSVLLINLFFCFIVLILLYSRIQTFTPQIDWDLDFKILIGANVLLIMLEHIVRPLKYRLSIIVFRMIIISLMIIPYPDTVFIDSFLVTGLYLSLVSSFPCSFTPYISIIYGGLYLLLKIVPASRHYGLLIGFDDIVLFLCFYGSFSLLHYLARYGISRHLETRKLFDNLVNTIDQLTAESSHFLKYAADAQESSSTEERKRITRELHDIIGKTFTDIIMMMEANERNPPEDSEELREIFNWVGAQSRYGLNEIRKVLYDLRSSIREEPIRLSSIRELAEPFSSSTHVEVHIIWANARNTYGTEIDKTIYYVIQEALVNALRHGKAETIQISFWEAESSVSVTIQDDGKKSSVGSTKGLGQTSMEERLAKVGGQIGFQRNSEGYQVRVEIPLRTSERRDGGEI